MKCEHCFYWKQLNQRDDLTFQEIVALSQDLGPIENLNLSGGEPFLRREFDAPVPEGVLTTLRGARVSAVERIAHRTHARPPSIWRDCGLLPVFWDRYSALARIS